MSVVGLDIGGANLKAADARGKAVTRPFAVWRAPEKLPGEIERLLAAFAKPEKIALTMTAELADCFRTKGEGVAAVLAATQQATGQAPQQTSGAIPIFVWQTTGRFVAPREACDAPLLTAAANWHALATFAGRLAPEGAALLIDVGTTTTDLIPLKNGVPTPAGFTDRERLQSSELVYTGVKRTPLCALVREVPFRGCDCPLAAELFATTLDVYLSLGQLPEDERDTETANGRPATIAAAHERLARSLCCDTTEFSLYDVQTMSHSIAIAQRRQIAQAIHAVMAAQGCCPQRLVISGAGSFVAEQTADEIVGLAESKRIRLADRFGPAIAEAACAFALACLLKESG